MGNQERILRDQVKALKDHTKALQESNRVLKQASRSDRMATMNRKASRDLAWRKTFEKKVVEEMNTAPRSEVNAMLDAAVKDQRKLVQQRETIKKENETIEKENKGKKPEKQRSIQPIPVTIEINMAYFQGVIAACRKFLKKK